MSFDFIAPKTSTLAVDGVEVTVQPFKVRRLPVVAPMVNRIMGGGLQAVKSAGEMIAAVQAQVSSGETAEDQAESLIGMAIGPVVLALIERDGDTVIELVAEATGMSADWVGDLYIDRLVALACEVIVVNVDFFSRALPGMQKAFAAVRSAKDAITTA